MNSKHDYNLFYNSKYGFTVVRHREVKYFAQNKPTQPSSVFPPHSGLCSSTSADQTEELWWLQRHQFFNSHQVIIPQRSLQMDKPDISTYFGF